MRIDQEVEQQRFDCDFTSLNPQDLNLVIKKATEEKAKRMEKIVKDFGQWFVNIIGPEVLFILPEVSAEALNLTPYQQDLSNRIRPSMLGTHSAVRGVLTNEHSSPFVAIKTEIFDPSEVQCNTVVEMIYRDYSVKDYTTEGKHEQSYTIVSNNSTEDGRIIPSILSSPGGINAYRLFTIRDLLEGKEISLNGLSIKINMYV